MTKSLRAALPKAASSIEKGIEQGLHFGAQVYVSLEAEVIVDDAIGHAYVDEHGTAGRELTTDDLALWLSACKPVTAVAFGQCWEAGKVDVDQTVSTVIPEFGKLGKEAITFRHLLTHTGGFRKAELGAISMDWNECIRRICDAPLEEGWTPGERAGYHDRPSWYILAEAVQRISGESFPEYVRERIFLPLGMNDSWIGMDPDRYDAYGDRVVPTYDTLRGARDEQSWHAKENVVACWPAGNGRGPIRELARFYEALLDSGNGILEPETVNELTRRHRTGMVDETFQHKIDWGLGFLVDSNHYGQATLPYSYGAHSSGDTFGHGGRQSTVGFADPAYRLAVGIAFNGMPGEPKHNKRIREVLTAIYEDLGLARENRD